MKANKSFIVLTATLCTFTSTFFYPMFLLKAIIRIERYEKPGCATIDLLYDSHDIEISEQELAITEYLAQQKGHVYVEDISEHVGSKHIQDTRDPSLWDDARPGSLVGLINRLKKRSLSSSTVECRSGLYCNKFAHEQEIVADYKAIRNRVKVINSTDPINKFCNTIIASVEQKEDSMLKNGLDQIPEGGVIGSELLDIYSLRKLCKKDERKYKALIAGYVHCAGVGLSLEHLGYNRMKCLEDKEKNTKIIYDAYQSFIPVSRKNSYILRSVSFSDSCSTIPLSTREIKEYFNNPSSYCTGKQKWFTAFSRLKNILL